MSLTIEEAGKHSTTGMIREEVGLWVGLATTVLFLIYGKQWLVGLGPDMSTTGLFIWLFGAILWLSFGVVRHADCLAIKLGEPYGTLILTLSVISIEAVMIATVMLTGSENPALARDTMFSVIMIVLNGMLGLTLLLGGLRHKEQNYNLAGARSYLSILATLAVISLIVPRFTSTPGGSLSVTLEALLLIVSLTLYLVFLTLQTRSHAGYYVQPKDPNAPLAEEFDHEHFVVRSIPYHTVLLTLTMLPIVLLAKSLAKILDFGIASAGAPAALGGFIVAILVLSPEAISAVKAALENKLQRTINIALGSATSTIGMTVPVVLAIALITERDLELGLPVLDIVLLSLTLLLATINFNSGRTNVLQGVVHLIVFATYVVLIFDS